MIMEEVSKYLTAEGVIKKEKYPKAYYSTNESEQGIFSDTSIAHYRLIMEDYEIKEFPKHIYKIVIINQNCFFKLLFIF